MYRLQLVVLFAALLVPANWSFGQDLHDQMLCNCRQIHKANDKDNFEDNAYVHDHDDGYEWYHFQSFNQKQWTRVIYYTDDDGKQQMYPKKWKSTSKTPSEYFPNGSCDNIEGTKKYDVTKKELINHTFSGSKISRARWTELKEFDVSVTGSSKIGAKGSVGVANTTLEGSQEYAVSVGTTLHESMSMENTFEASVTVTNAEGEEHSTTEENTISYTIPPCKMGIFDSYSVFENELYEFEREAHSTTCKYEGYVWDTNNHVTICPQGKCRLLLHGKKATLNIKSFFTRDIDFDNDPLPAGFQCDDCGKKDGSNPGPPPSGSGGNGNV